MNPREKYRVIRKLDSGGMAEVFVGEAEGLQGFKKAVAIKRVLPHLVQNSKFLKMFLDEARLSLRMTHANIVQVFDIGQSGGTYFIVMEYVDGTNLKRLMESLRERGTRMPLAHAIFIIMEVCRGLAYAHSLTDADGNNLGLVHRDVSPPNILLSKQGEVKIVDFGLAKATSQLEHTDPGVVKGKFAYLAPEAAWGRPVDHRADIFACGIILWELLTGHRLFLGETDVQTVELVRRGDVPPLVRYNPEVRPELEQIVRRALAPNVADRFQSCDDLGEALAGYLFSQRLKVTNFDLQRMVKSVVAEDERKRPHVSSIIDKLIQEELDKFATLDANTPGSPDGHPVEDPTGAVALDPSGFEDPRAWLGELGVEGSDSIIPGDGPGGWRESGLVRRESTPTGRAVSPPLAVAPLESDTPSLAQMLEGEGRPGPEAAEDGGQARWVIIGAVLFAAIVVAAGLAAYALGIIP